MRFTLKQLSYFIAAGEAESITGAAQAAHVSQASVSAAVSHLESVFGVQLCIRHHAQGLSLTPAGRRLLDEARRLVAQAGELELDVKALGGKVAGPLEIGCFQTLAPLLMPSLIRQFEASHPDVEITCTVGHQEELYAGLRDGRFLMALTYDLDLGADLLFEPLASLPPYAILPASHPLAKRSTLQLSDLASEPMVFLDLPLSRAYFLSLFYSKGLEPRIAHRFASTDMVRGMVAHGFGYALLNARTASCQALDGTPFVTRDLKDDLRPLHLGLARRADLRLPRIAEAFLDHCREHLPAQLGSA